MAIELSLDLVEEILLRVPAQYLVPWRYVCKQWKTLIGDPRFTKKHSLRFPCLEQQFTVFNRVTYSRALISKCIVSSSVVYSLVGINYNELNNIDSLCSKVLKPWDILVYNMSHCDGLLLLVTRFELLVLNPLLKEGRWIIPDSNFHGTKDVYGLGYISSDQSSSRSCNHDYKIVKFAHEKDLGFISIYDFNSDSWKVVVNETFDGFVGLPKSSVCLRGTPYWLGYNHKFKLSIRSFDFSKERFDSLCLPPDECIYYVYSLGIYRGDHLSLLYTTGRSTIKIWVMMKKQWSMLMKVDNIPPLWDTAGLMHSIENNGKLVLSVSSLNSRGPVTIYIIGENQECQKLEYNPSVYSISGYCYYVPSLISIPRPVKVSSKRRRI